MSLAFRSHLFSCIAANVLIGGLAGNSDASWVTYKNDTTKTIVIQESTTVNGQVKRGKPMTLMPGESLREFIPGPTAKKIEVFEVQNPNQSIWSGSLNCKDDAQTFSVSAAGGKVAVLPVVNPQNPKK